MTEHPSDTPTIRFRAFWGGVLAMGSFGLLSWLITGIGPDGSEGTDEILNRIAAQRAATLKAVDAEQSALLDAAKLDAAKARTIDNLSGKTAGKKDLVVPGSPTFFAQAAEQGIPDSPLARSGEQTYNVFCASCHQAGAVGKVGMAPSIRNRDFLALASDKFIKDTIRMGRPGTAMVSWAHLNNEQLDGLVAYLRSVAPKNPVTFKVDPNKRHPGDAAAGAATYQTYCASCHGVNGTGYAEGVAGPAIGMAGFNAVASDDFIFQTLKHGRIGTPMRPFSGPEGLANLSDEELGNVIAFLRTMPDREPIPVAARDPDPAIGKQQFDVNCAACHQQGGIGLAGFAPSIRNRDFLAIASDDFIRQTIHDGRIGTAMLPRPDLSEQTASDIIAYLRALPIANAAPIVLNPELKLEGNPAEGHQKYAVFCATCHGQKGEGYAAGGSGPGIGLPGFLNAASDDYIYQTLKRGRIGTAMRPFLGPTGIANLSEEDVADIVAHLRNLNGAKTASN